MRFLSYLVFFLAYIIAFNSYSQKKSPFLRSTKLEQGLELAQQENKKVLLYFTAKWCGPCKTMERDVFPDDSVNLILDSEYIPLKINIESWYGKSLAKEYEIGPIPQFVILDFNKEKEAHYDHAMSLPEFIDFLNRHTNFENHYAPKLNSNLKPKKTSYTPPPVRQPQVGIRINIPYLWINGISASGRVGFGTDIFLSYQKSKFLIRPGVGFLTAGTDQDRFRKLRFPIDLAYNIRGASIFGLPGNYRLIISPYYSILLDPIDNIAGSQDFGVRYGLAAYVGDDSKIEAILLYEQGFKDLYEQPGMQGLRMLSLAFSLTLPNF